MTHAALIASLRDMADLYSLSLLDVSTLRAAALAIEELVIERDSRVFDLECARKERDQWAALTRKPQ